MFAALTPGTGVGDGQSGRPTYALAVNVGCGLTIGPGVGITQSLAAVSTKPARAWGAGSERSVQDDPLHARTRLRLRPVWT